MNIRSLCNVWALFEEGLSWIEMMANCDNDVDNDGDTDDMDDDIEYDDDGGEYEGRWSVCNVRAQQCFK